MYYIGLDVHKKTISYRIKEANGHIHAEGRVGRQDVSWTIG
jgi:transposase